MIKCCSIFLMSLLILAAPHSLARGPNVIRFGAGANFHASYESYRDMSFSPGPSVYIEYERDLADYVALSMLFRGDSNNYGVYSDLYGLNVNVRAMFRPFPRSFRRLEVGMGVSTEYRVDMYRESTRYFMFDEDGRWHPFLAVSHTRQGHVLWGVSVPVRLHLFDNGLLDLALSFSFNFNKNSKGFGLNNTDLGLFFGVRF